MLERAVGAERSPWGLGGPLGIQGLADSCGHSLCRGKIGLSLSFQMADPEVEASFLILVLGPETEVLCLSHSSCREPQCVILVLKPLVPASVWGRGPCTALISY